MNRKIAAFTRLELIVCALVMMLLCLTCIPWLFKPKTKHGGACPSNLKNIGLAFRTWSTDNGDVFPMEKSTNHGGTKEYIGTTQVFRHYLPLTNELSTPRHLVCPNGRTLVAANWQVLANQNIDYFVGVDATATAPFSLLSGDRFITSNVPLINQMLVLGINASVTWLNQPHDSCGNIALGDGSVQTFTAKRLQEYIPHNLNEPIRLAIPQ